MQQPISIEMLESVYLVESLVELKFDSGFRVIGKYLSQIDSEYRFKLTLNIESY